MKILNAIKHPVRMVMSYVAPRQLASIYYRKVMHKPLNWKNPKDINEKINWLKFYSDTSIWPLLADKYRVREYVEEKGLARILVKLYGVWENANDIDFNTLPNSFVLKTNHGSGTNIIVKNKSEIDESEIRKQLNKWLKLRFGRETVEFHYLKIKPVIIAEEYLEEKNNTFSRTLVDYKVWCFNGIPHHIWPCYNREQDYTYVGIYDTDWKYRPEGSIFNDHYRDGHGCVPKPENLDDMLNVARILSQGLPQARIDFYDIDGKLYLGEITMASQGGYMYFNTPDFLLEMGSKVTLPTKKRVL